MNLDEFQRISVDTAAIKQQGIPALAHRSLGLADEAGYVAGVIKKIIRDKEGSSSTEDVEILKKRLGDVMYYTALLADYFGLSMTEIAKQNAQQSIEFKKARQ